MMIKHFISVLGTGLYEPVIYYDDVYNGKEKEWEFVQFAIIDKYKDQLSDSGCITIFVTEKSYKENYLNRIYTERDVQNAGRWQSKAREKVMEGTVKVGFGEQFEHTFPELADRLQVVEIPSGKNEDEIWEIFNELYSQIGEEEEILFDVTHAFRSIPIIMMSVMNYVKVMKSCVLGNISYGAFEAAEVRENQKYAQMINLTSLDEILDWSNAANEFIKYGNSSMMKSVYDTKFKTLPDEEKKNWKGVQNIVKAISELSDAILTSRGNHEFVHEPAKSITGAYNRLVTVSSDESLQKMQQIRPLFLLFEKTRDVFDIFEQEEGYQIGLAVVKWSIQNNMIQQGYTALEESLKTFMCYYYNLNQIDIVMREDVCSSSTFYLDEKHRKLRKKQKSNPDMSQSEEELRAEIISEIRKKPGKNWGKPNPLGTLENVVDKVCEIVATFPFEFAVQIQNIKDERNDINHFGMRNHVLPANKFSKKLKEHYDIVTEYIERMIKNREDMLKGDKKIYEIVNAKKPEQSHTIFLNYSNHPYSMWSQKQKDAAKIYADSFEELEFPVVSSEKTHMEIEQLAKKELEKILQYHPNVVMCQGEFTLTYRLVERLKQKNITVIAACSERKVEDVFENGVCTKKAVFEFVQFREY